MDIKTASQIVDRLLRSPDERIGAGDRRLDAAALAVADTNRDGKADRLELVTALVQEKIKPDGARLVVAGKTGDYLPAPGRSGLGPRNWMQGTILAGGDPTHPPLATTPSSPGYVYTPGPNSFAQVAANVKTPDQVAAFLQGSDGSVARGLNISYDNNREIQSGQLQVSMAGLSSQELLDKGEGVCRDQAALARDLLVANGYQAEELGYMAPDQMHAITAYRDPKTGYWGIIEYGTLYPASQLQAHTPEEALLMVRPATLSILQYENNGPNKPSDINGILYTPEAQLYESFMAGPPPGAGNGITASNTGVTATAALSGDGTWQGAMQVVTDPRYPNLQGAVLLGAWKTFDGGGFRAGAGAGIVPNDTQNLIGSNVTAHQTTYIGFLAAQEYHPDILAWKDIGGSGVKVSLNSHAQAQIALADDASGIDPGTSAALSNIKWTPDVTVERSFAIWQKQHPDSRAFVSYGVGADGFLLAAHYQSGGTGLPLNQYVTGGISTQIRPWLGVALQGYAPVTNYTNDFSAAPLVRAEVSLPHIHIGTTQGADLSSYDVSAGLKIGHVDLGAFGGVTQDRQTGVTAPIIGGRLNLTW